MAESYLTFTLFHILSVLNSYRKVKKTRYHNLKLGYAWDSLQLGLFQKKLFTRKNLCCEQSSHFTFWGSIKAKMVFEKIHKGLFRGNLITKLRRFNPNWSWHSEVPRSQMRLSAFIQQRILVGLLLGCFVYLLLFLHGNLMLLLVYIRIIIALFYNNFFLPFIWSILGWLLLSLLLLFLLLSSSDTRRSLRPSSRLFFLHYLHNKFVV